MGEHETTGIFESLVEKLPGDYDIYFWNFVILMFFTLFEVAAVFFETIPGTDIHISLYAVCLLYTSPSPRDGLLSRMPSSA